MNPTKQYTMNRDDEQRRWTVCPERGQDKSNVKHPGTLRKTKSKSKHVKKESEIID